MFTYNAISNYKFENNEICKIPTDTERGYIPEILLLIGKYVDKIKYKVSKYENCKRSTIRHLLERIMCSHNFVKDKMFLSLYPVYNEKLYNTKGIILNDIRNLVISQINGTLNYNFLMNISKEEICYGIKINIDLNEIINDSLLKCYNKHVGDIEVYIHILSIQYDIYDYEEMTKMRKIMFDY